MLGLDEGCEGKEESRRRYCFGLTGPVDGFAPAAGAGLGEQRCEVLKQDFGSNGVSLWGLWGSKQ